MLTTRIGTEVVEVEVEVAGHSLTELEQIKPSHQQMMAARTGNVCRPNYNESMENSMELTKICSANFVTPAHPSRFPLIMCKEIHTPLHRG